MRVERIGDAVLYLGDCLEILPTLARVDAVVTDPPYCSGGVGEAQRSAAKGQGRRSENLSRFGWFTGDNMGTAGLSWLLRSVAVCARGLMPDSGHFLSFCDWRMVSALQPAIESAGLRYQNLIVWDKGHFGLGLGFRKQHELILHYTLGAPQYHDRATGNVIREARVGADRLHQTEKPTALMGALIAVVTPLGGVVLDPFMGSGTTGVSCAQLGRRFIGIENDEGNFTIACERIERVHSQRGLFIEPQPKPVQEVML